MQATIGEDKSKQWRVTAGKKSKEDDEDEAAAAAKRERSNKYTASAINGKQILAVKCKNQTAELHLSRFANGIRGNSIKYKDEWMTPQDFENACGTSNNKYLENIQTDYGPLKTLTASGRLKPHSRKCRCSVCRGEETSPKTDKLKAKKRPKNLEEEGEIDDEQQHQIKNTEAIAGENENQDQAQQGDDIDDHQQLHQKDKSERGSAKRKKKKHQRDEWRKQLLAEQLKQEAVNAHHQQQQHQQQHHHQQQQHHHQQLALAQQPNTITIMDDVGGYDQQQQMHHVQIQQPQDMYVTAISAINPNMVSTLSDMPPKISTPSMMQNRIEPPQHALNAQPPTFYVMSPHPHITAPPTPQHNPFATMGPPPPSPAPSLVSAMTSPIMTSQKSSQNGILMRDTASVSSLSDGESNASTPTSTSNTPVSTPRMGPVMNVRCKSTTAVMYTAKYESGSKGKCIQLGEEWLTPNEFEDRAGSKAKKYLSSIKCLGRPLRVFVNSGELKGSGPPPAQKVQKKVKPTTMQPIAPAPPPGATAGILTASAGPQIGQMATAPPTPSHISNAPPIPANLNMVMGGHSQPPILINQTSMASTIMGNQAMMPMTFTIGAPIGDPIDVRQNVSQAM